MTEQAQEIYGIVNVYKEKGYTSHDVVAVVRKMLGGVKAGHTGTLDPAAEGVLPICLGKATKIAEYLAAETKGYVAVLNLGRTTDTDDETGREIFRKPVDSTEEEINAAVRRFQKDYWQIPPMYSAIKMDGKKLYELARQGKTAERQARLVYIYKLKIMEFMPDHKIRLDILCSKGTYIRSLCRDIGDALGCGGNMGHLLRVSSGQFNLADSIKLPEMEQLVKDGKFTERLITIEQALSDYPRVRLNARGDKYLHNGNKISSHYIEGHGLGLNERQQVLVYDSTRRLGGLYELSADMDALKPMTMLL